MLLVFVRERGDSFRNVDRREVAAMKSNHVFHPTPPKFNRYRISFQNHQDGLNTKHTTSQALSAGCGGNMSTRNTMLPVINRGGPGSYRSRERCGVISQKETQFYSKAQQIRSEELESAFSEQKSSLEKPHTGAYKPYPLAAAATYDEKQAQFAADFHLRVRWLP